MRRIQEKDVFLRKEWAKERFWKQMSQPPGVGALLVSAAGHPLVPEGAGVQLGPRHFRLGPGSQV